MMSRSHVDKMQCPMIPVALLQSCAMGLGHCMPTVIAAKISGSNLYTCWHSVRVLGMPCGRLTDIQLE